MPEIGMLRKIDTNSFIASQMVPTKLPVIKYGRDIALYLSGSLTTGTSPTVVEDAPMSVIKAIELVAASGDTSKNGSLHRIAGIDLYALNAFETGSFGWVKRHGTANATLYAFGCLLVLPFTTFPIDSLNLLPQVPPVFSNLELQVTWGTIADMGTNVGTSFTVSPTLGIYEVTREAPPTPNPAMMKTIVKYMKLNASDSNDIDLKTGLPIQSILLKVMDNGVRSDTFVTDIDLIENDTINHLASIPWGLLQAYARYRGMMGYAMGYPFVEAADTNTATAEGLGLVNRSTMKGYQYINLIDLEGSPIPTSTMDSFKLRLKTTTSAGGTPGGYAILRHRVG
jgi:hypothetical protein